MAYSREYTGLHLVTLDQEGHDRTCNYWYLIQSFGCTSLTAFTERTSLLRWLGERGLELTAPMPEHGQHSHQVLKGTYRDTMHGSRSEFDAIAGHPAYRLDNARYTAARITLDADGVPNVHCMNCNCERDEFDYAALREMVG